MKDKAVERQAVESAPKREADELIQCENLNIFYGANRAITDLNMNIKKNTVTTFIGPSGCGKSTLLRAINRMNDFIECHSIEGKIYINGEDIYSPKIDPVSIRLKVGMVFQSPNPFPKSIYDNIAMAPKLNGYKADPDELVERSLKGAFLWKEVKDKLHESAYSLSGGQQQRLCIARAIAMEPGVILLDEPTSALDPISTTKIEDLILRLKEKYTIVIVTHNMQQAARIGDYTGFFYQGELVEFDNTETIFTNPSQKMTEDYITGRFG